MKVNLISSLVDSIIVLYSTITTVFGGTSKINMIIEEQSSFNPSITLISEIRLDEE